MIITEKFVFIHLPKTGGTFAQKMIQNAYTNLNTIDRVKRKLGLISCEKIDIKRNKKNSPRVIGQHGSVHLIPLEHQKKDIVSIYRSPYTKYISQYEFKWWQRHPNVTYDYSYESHPKFPNLTFKDHYKNLDNIIIQLNENKKPNIPIGFQTFQFIRYYFKNPEFILKNLTESYIENDEYLNDIYPIKFIFNENLNKDLYQLLKQYGYQKYRISNINKAERIYPEGIGKKEHNLNKYYDKQLLNEIYEKDYLIFKFFKQYQKEYTLYKDQLM